MVKAVVNLPATMYSDAQKILQWVKQDFQYSSLMLFGHSLGTAMTSKLAYFGTPFDEIKCCASVATCYTFSFKTSGALAGASQG